MENSATKILLFIAVGLVAFAGVPMGDGSLPAAPPLGFTESIPAPSLPLEVKVSAVTYLSAEAAEVLPDGPSAVVVFVEGLKPGRKYGAILAVENQPVEFIEVHAASHPFPPTVQKPFRDNAFLIAGNPGEVFYVSVRALGQPPTWHTITIAGDAGAVDPVDPVKPVPVPDGEIRKLSKARADALNDPPTRTRLKASLTAVVEQVEAMCVAGNCPDVSAAARMVVAAIESVMASRTGDSQYAEWKIAWRTPVSNAIGSKSAATTAEYLSLVKEAALGL